jgi:hypothetical protein
MMQQGDRRKEMSSMQTNFILLSFGSSHHKIFQVKVQNKRHPQCRFLPFETKPHFVCGRVFNFFRKVKFSFVKTVCPSQRNPNKINGSSNEFSAIISARVSFLFF